MTYIEQAIQKAVAGGWRSGFRFDYDALASNPTDEGFQHAIWLAWKDKTDTAFLDPSFWESLGKAMGWDNIICKACERSHAIEADCDAGFGERIQECFSSGTD